MSRSKISLGGSANIVRIANTVEESEVAKVDQVSEEVKITIKTGNNDPMGKRVFEKTNPIKNSQQSGITHERDPH